MAERDPKYLHLGIRNHVGVMLWSEGKPRFLFDKNGVKPLNGAAGFLPGTNQSFSPRLVHTGGIPAQASTDGTNLDAVVTEIYVAELWIPGAMTVTGAAVFWGANTNGNAKVMLFDSRGVRIGISASTDVSGYTADSYGSRIPFRTPVVADGPGTYYLGVMCDDNTNDINTHVLGSFGAGKITGKVYATETGYESITPPSTFTTGLAPIASLY